MARLLHLNGPPGIGKSTLAGRYVAEHPGVLNLDIDVLRTLIGGWESDFAAAGALVRPAAIAMMTSYLASGHDVVLPQLISRPEELARFEDAALSAGASFVEVVLMDTREAALARFHSRGDGSASTRHAQVRSVVVSEGGDAVLDGYYDALSSVVALRPDALVIDTVAGDVDGAYAALVAAVNGRS